MDRIAAAWAVRMARLGDGRYGAQGGDWGSAMTRSLAAHDAPHGAGIHVTLATGSPPPEAGEPDADERLDRLRRRSRAGAAAR